MHELELITRSGPIILMAPTRKQLHRMFRRFVNPNKEEKMPRKLIKPAHDDPHNSIDLFDADRKNEFGEMYCVAPAILPQQVNNYWIGYLKNKGSDIEIY